MKGSSIHLSRWFGSANGRCGDPFRALRSLLPLPVIGFLLVLGVAACAPEHSEGGSEVAEPRAGTVEDVDRFRQFLESRPTPEAFERVYPGVHLVLPGDIVTQEYRTDRSRFFAELDEQGRITGGEFR